MASHNEYELERKQRMEINSARLRALGLVELRHEVAVMHGHARGGSGAERKRRVRVIEEEGQSGRPDPASLRRSARQRDQPAEHPTGKPPRKGLKKP